jgi:hypothetical protein
VKRPILSSLLAWAFALAIYAIALPWLALRLDRWLGLIWRLPSWIDPVSALLILAGIGLAAFTLRAWPSRDPLMLGAWLFGAGLACLLRSASLMVLSGAVVIAAAAGPRLRRPEILARLEDRWKRLPRWTVPALVVAGVAAGLPAVTRALPPAHITEPAILVQIRCKPGTADLWRADFEQHVRPAIDEVLARGDTFTRFQLLTPALPAQGFDFVLLYTGKTFAELDQPRPFPQYVALFQREGAVRTLAALREMGSLEDHVSVTLVHLSRTR